jgi:ABC-type Zn uptake system ZnuABC Zn-binding protein ZnuA
LQPRSIESLKQSRLLIRASMDDGGWPIPPSHNNTLDLWPEASHGWLSPEQVQKALPRLSEALKKLNPQHAVAIEHRLSRATAKAALFGQQWKQALANTKSVIMQHPSWLPLMKDLDIRVLAVLESEHHGHESGPRQLEEALASLNLHPDTWLVADLAHSTRPLDWLARHANTPPRRITLDPLGRCGEGWDELMEENLERTDK